MSDSLKEAQSKLHDIRRFLHEAGAGEVRAEHIHSEVLEVLRLLEEASNPQRKVG